MNPISIITYRSANRAVLSLARTGLSASHWESKREHASARAATRGHHIRAGFSLVAFFLTVLVAGAQDITGAWHVTGVATMAEANPAEVATTEWDGMMTIANMGGSDYRLTFSGAE